MTQKPVILVIDDDLPILTLMGTILREYGFDPQVAGTGEAAIAAARAKSPDLILLDKNMPGMAGEEVIDALRAAGVGGIPILILSGDPVDREEIARLGVTGAVQKPFDVPALIDTIRGHVGAAKS
ncbi:MAG: response regulator [Thermoanaerobaculia bacterium]